MVKVEICVDTWRKIAVFLSHNGVLLASLVLSKTKAIENLEAFINIWRDAAVFLSRNGVVSVFLFC